MSKFLIIKLAEFFQTANINHNNPGYYILPSACNNNSDLNVICRETSNNNSKEYNCIKNKSAIDNRSNYMFGNGGKYDQIKKYPAIDGRSDYSLVIVENIIRIKNSQ